MMAASTRIAVVDGDRLDPGLLPLDEYVAVTSWDRM